MGVGSGKTRRFKDLSADEKLDVAAAPRMARRRSKRPSQFGQERERLTGGSRAHFYNGDWLRRAAVARAGIYANDAAEATYLFARTDREGDRSTASSTPTR
jgi:hypothetical protein